MKLPWKTTEPGQGFFVPALDLDTVREEGLLAAVKLRILDAQALYCIHDGKLGVLFYRAKPSLKPLVSAVRKRRARLLPT